MVEVLTFHYELLDDYGNLLESSYKKEKPITFIAGSGQIIFQIEQTLLDLKVGEKKKICLPSTTIFSSANKGKSVEVDRDDFAHFPYLQVGDQVSLREKNGQVCPYTVIAVKKHKLRLVSCGLFSREDMTFQLELLARRPLTKTEVLDGCLKTIYPVPNTISLKGS